METGRVINERYLLKRLMKQSQFAVIYQGVDQVLQRDVAVKAVPAAHIQPYHTASKLTAQFSHPHIVGLYDLVMENASLYLIQELIEGEDFSMLLQRQLSPYEVASLGCQVCEALLYATSSSYRLCHGDLTPTAFTRDHHGLVRINNFALPSDLYYFTNWGNVGGEGTVVSDRGLPWGQFTEARHTDDTRAVGLLLYQFLVTRQPGAIRVDPPVDGQLRFPRTVPADLCNLIARVLIRKHPQPITNALTLYSELKPFADAMEPAIPVLVPAQQPEKVGKPRPITPPGSGKLVSALPVREGGQPGTGLSAYSSKLTAVEAASPAAPTVADNSLKLATARPRPYSTEQTKQRSPVLMLLLIGLVVFALFFLIGLLAGHFIFG